MINLTGAGIGTFSSTPDARQRAQMSNEEWLKKFRAEQEKRKAEYANKPLKIEDLSAYSLNQVQQSLDKYNKGYEDYKAKDPYNTMPRALRGDTDWNQEAAKRERYKKADYGIEDEFRYMVEELGFEGQRGGNGMGIGEQGPNGEQGPPPGLKPGDKGYSYDPNNFYNGTQGSGLPGRNGAPGIPGQQGTQQGNYDYSGYDAAAISAGVQGSGNVSTKFYNKAYGASVEQGESQFGHADLEGNLAAGITSTQLKEWFDNGGAASLGAKQVAGTGGIYDQVAAAAAAEEEVKIQKAPKPTAPPPMRIPGATVGNAGNASGVRAKRSNSSRSGRNARGTSQFNRRSFGNPKTSALTIGGLNI